MTKTILAVLVLAGTTGCMTNQLARTVAALGKDPATVHVRISTIYGTIEFARTNPMTNSLSHTVSPDGTITVDKAKP